MEANSQPKWLSTEEAAAFLEVSVESIRRWADKGILPHHRLPGGARRFDEAELKEWLDKQRKGRR